MNEIKKIYYAHPISIYDTPQEERDLDLIKQLWPDAEIYNPNTKEDQLGYKRDGFDWFLNRVEECQLVVFRAFPDGKIGAGVWSEINWGDVQCHIPIIEIPMLMESRKLSIDDTREYLKHAGKR